jgi:hypothetical protein
LASLSSRPRCLASERVSSGRPTLSVTLTPTLAAPAPTFETTLDNGLVASGQCALASNFPESTVSLELAHGIGATHMLVSGVSIVGSTATGQTGLKTTLGLSRILFSGESVALALIAVPSDLDGNPLGSVVRVDIQGTFSVGPGPALQCSFWGVIVPYS